MHGETDRSGLVETEMVLIPDAHKPQLPLKLSEVRVRVRVRVSVRFAFYILGFSFIEYIHAVSFSM